MPNMNRIRVNNVKYNFGTQQYDDFVMRMHGKNTIYDLANGGGKSVLMLLLLQNLIPNCTLDEKQPIEKLFRTSGGSTTIHSLVEWNLDEAVIEEDYRYLLTGFCARKAKDTTDGESADRDTASIEYFNYCIFYRAYNSNDLVNLPLVQNGERITYTGLRNYLKDLERNAPELKVFVFERKGEYQQFISGYGLYESAWEIIRGINKTEGHVRTYFETNYKTTRKVVEDLLIEEIIEKSFRDKTDKEDLNESMAKTLLDIKDKLMELSEKKSEMNQYEHQKELLSVLRGRVQALKDLYTEKEELSLELLSAYNMLKQEAEQEEETLLSMKQEITQKGEECVEKDRVIACLKVQQEESVLQQQEKEEQELQLAVKNAEIQYVEQQRLYQDRENGNDYLEYVRLRQKRDEEEAVIDKARHGSGDYIERLYDYASVKKQFMEDRLADVRKKQEEATAAERELKINLKSLMKAKRELECDQAVCLANQERLKIQYKTKEEQLTQQKNETSLLLLEDVQKEIRSQQKQLSQTVTALEQCRKQQEETKKRAVELSLKQQELTLRRESADSQTDYRDSLRRLLEEGEERVQALAGTCHRENVSAFSARELQELLRLMQERSRQAFGALAEEQRRFGKLEQLKQAQMDGHLVADTEFLESLRDYLVNRHGLAVMLGQDYILEKDLNEREELLHRWPFVPYGLVLLEAGAEELSGLLQDARLRSMASNQVIPVLTEELLALGEQKNQEGILFLQGAEKGFWEKEGFADAMEETEEQLSQSRQEQEQLSEMVGMLEEDCSFLMGQIALVKLYETEQDPDERILESGEERVVDWEAQQQQLEKEIQENQHNSAELMEQEEEQSKRRQEQEEELSRLSHIGELFAELKQIGAERNAEQERAETLLQKLQQTDGEIETGNRKLKETREQKSAYQQQLEEGEQQWKQVYAPYYKERPVLDLGYTERQLDAEFMSMKTIVEQGMVSVADKQTLVDTLNHNMEQLMRNLKRRGADCEKLQQRQEAGELYVVGEAELNSLSRECSRYRGAWENAKEQLAQIQKEKSKCEGRIEHGMKQLEEQGIRYTRLGIEPENLQRAIEEQRQVFASLLKTKEEMTNEFISMQKRHSRHLDFCKDVKRMIELYHLKVTEDMQLQDVSQYTLEQLRQCQADFEKLMAKEQKARQEMEQYKQQTAQTLMELKAFELAEVIRRDVVLPETMADMQELLDSLQDMIGYIQLEQERVEQGIQDMELIKSNFENQCIRRCQDVKTELERLPKLSGITLDGENIQMISLKIPYVSEEEAATKMSDYIERIVKDVDRFDSFHERMRYIRSQLALKRLFSVVVTDMNAIRLNLYKRERIKEQSRYLRYEEAVGSTGQSQGIYIQFLIAIINYIANIHSVSSDNSDLSKVIFIDNPFGAAKDIYIWEPIFEMLKTNNVQLIVPARGATPAITGRFDVNYILGQKLVAGKQQTVVVDYRSQVEKTELEYKRLEFTQNSFDFI